MSRGRFSGAIAGALLGTAIAGCGEKVELVSQGSVDRGAGGADAGPPSTIIGPMGASGGQGGDSGGVCFCPAMDCAPGSHLVTSPGECCPQCELCGPSTCPRSPACPDGEHAVVGPGECCAGSCATIPDASVERPDAGACRFEYLGDWIRCEHTGYPNDVGVPGARDLQDCMDACLRRSDCTAVTDYFWLNESSPLPCVLYVSTCDAPFSPIFAKEDGGKDYRKVCSGVATSGLLDASSGIVSDGGVHDAGHDGSPAALGDR